MHLAIELQRLDDLGTEDLQRTAIVVQLDARGPRDEPIGEHRRQPAIDERILAVLAPAAHDVDCAANAVLHRASHAAFQTRHHRRQIGSGSF